MTTFEHAMLAGNLAAAAGLHRRHGHGVLAIAAVAGASPDRDGVTFLWSVEAFDRGHRVWGHGLPVAVPVGAAVGAAAACAGLGRRAVAAVGKLEGVPALDGRGCGVGVAAGIGAAAAASHIPADVVVSGTDTLADWPVPVLWPFGGPEVVYPMLHWGDPGPTLIFAAGSLIGVWRKLSASRTAAFTLGVLAGYLILGRLSL